MNRKNEKYFDSFGRASSCVFQDKEYPIRSLWLNTLGVDLTVSTEQLNSDLLNQNDNYVSALAQEIDEFIFGFVPDEILKFASNRKLKKYIMENLL